MGLDMFLRKHTYVGSWDNSEYNVVVTRNGQPTQIDSKKITHVVEEFAYWRKANAIHKWFVENIQSNKDDCGEYYVSGDNFTKLMNDCRSILENPESASKVLPTASGFFFGGTEYNDWYRANLLKTIEICKDALDSMEKERCSFYYHADW